MMGLPSRHINSSELSESHRGALPLAAMIIGWILGLVLGITVGWAIWGG